MDSTLLPSAELQLLEKGCKSEESEALVRQSTHVTFSAREQARGS